MLYFVRHRSADEFGHPIATRVGRATKHFNTALRIAKRYVNADVVNQHLTLIDVIKGGQSVLERHSHA
jgi:hypothetical protein